jgi:hypothetical protein
MADLRRVYNLFLDVNRCRKTMTKSESQMINDDFSATK